MSGIIKFLNLRFFDSSMHNGIIDDLQVENNKTNDELQEIDTRLRSLR